MTPGETPIWSAVDAGSGISYLDDTTMPGIYARAIGAAVVVIERGFPDMKTVSVCWLN
jgi:hypothetical protein